MIFFSLRRLTTKHLKGTHRTDSWAETIWQKLVRQFQVRPTTSSTRTSQLGQQAFTATGCCFSTKSSSLRKSFMKLLFFHGTCHWNSPYSTKFVASSFGHWKKKRNHAVYKDMLLRHMFLYFLNNNGFTEDLWLITEFFSFQMFCCWCNLRKWKTSTLILSDLHLNAAVHLRQSCSTFLSSLSVILM